MLMGKAKRLKKMRKNADKSLAESASEAFTRNFRKEIRDSEIWDRMVEEFGEKRAFEILRDCKAEVKTSIDGK